MPERQNVAMDAWTEWSRMWAPPVASWQAVWEYWVDAAQRTVLFWDVMRKRGNMYLEHEAKGKPPVLVFEHEMVLDGRTLERPVNYFLLRIIPPAGMRTDPRKRPFVVFDPRAGHGPGIGGSKADSEIGVAVRAGHPVYFVGFRSDPEPGQTLGDVGHAEAVFLQKIAELHPEADGRPCVVGNCQAGWAVMMLSSVAPDLVGPILLAGAPLSYWAGEGTQNPMRYAGGLLGGSWMASLASDLGHGRFDGAYLVQNFEGLNPANTLWTKRYNLYSKIDTEEPRYLDFEKWWGGFFLLNEDEIQFIVDNLFVGNRLAAGGIVTQAGHRVDLRNIRSPIVVFASWGDNITPPQQALNWILDCYPTDRDLMAREQTIVYILHEDIGHLGIFVSGRIAQREHSEIVQALDIIETLPPGLWEMVITDKQPDASHADLIPGRYIVQFERRNLQDIRALDTSRQDERPFAAVARVSEINQGIYRTFLAPWIQLWSSEASARALRNLHPNRLQHTLWSNQNPWMAGVERMADIVRRHRQPVSADNPLLAFEQRMSNAIEQSLDQYRDARDRASERLFGWIYNSPVLQAAIGLRSAAADTAVVQARDEAFETMIAHKIAVLRARMNEGGLREAVVRMLMYAGADDPRVDVRGFRMAEQLRDKYLVGERLPGPRRREMVREQFFLLILDEVAALAALPRMLPLPADRITALDATRQILSAKGELSAERRARLARIETILNEKVSEHVA